MRLPRDRRAVNRAERRFDGSAIDGRQRLKAPNTGKPRCSSANSARQGHQQVNSAKLEFFNAELLARKIVDKMFPAKLLLL